MKGNVLRNEKTRYTDKQTGEVKEWRVLKIIVPPSKRQIDGVKGGDCMVFNPKFDVDDLNYMDLVEFEYEARAGKSGAYYILNDITLIKPAAVAQ